MGESWFSLKRLLLVVVYFIAISHKVVIAEFVGSPIRVVTSLLIKENPKSDWNNAQETTIMPEKTVGTHLMVSNQSQNEFSDILKHIFNSQTDSYSPKSSNATRKTDFIDLQNKKAMFKPTKMPFKPTSSYRQPTHKPPLQYKPTQSSEQWKNTPQWPPGSTVPTWQSTYSSQSHTQSVQILQGEKSKFKPTLSTYFDDSNVEPNFQDEGENPNSFFVGAESQISHHQASHNFTGGELPPGFPQYPPVAVPEIPEEPLSTPPVIYRPTFKPVIKEFNSSLLTVDTDFLEEEVEPLAEVIVNAENSTVSQNETSLNLPELAENFDLVAMGEAAAMVSDAATKYINQLSTNSLINVLVIFGLPAITALLSVMGAGPIAIATIAWFIPVAAIFVLPDVSSGKLY